VVEDSKGMGSGGLEGARAFHFRAVSFALSHSRSGAKPRPRGAGRNPAERGEAPRSGAKGGVRDSQYSSPNTYRSEAFPMFLMYIFLCYPR
jgi:hypothetical protein